VFVDAEWNGTLVTDSSWNDQSTIQSQLFYTIGQLNGMNSVGRIDKAVISNIVKTTVGGRTQIKYKAKLLVAWGNRNNVPASPKASGCVIAPADVDTVTATFSPSPVETTGKFPEYTKVWEDNTLNVVAIFGKNVDGATASTDPGIAAYNRFVAAMRSELSTRGLTTVPGDRADQPGRQRAGYRAQRHAPWRATGVAAGRNSGVGRSGVRSTRSRHLGGHGRAARAVEDRGRKRGALLSSSREPDAVADRQRSSSGGVTPSQRASRGATSIIECVGPDRVAGGCGVRPGPRTSSGTRRS